MSTPPQNFGSLGSWIKNLENQLKAKGVAELPPRDEFKASVGTAATDVPPRLASKVVDIGALPKAGGAAPVSSSGSATTGSAPKACLAAIPPVTPFPVGKLTNERPPATTAKASMLIATAEPKAASGADPSSAMADAQSAPETPVVPLDPVKAALVMAAEASGGAKSATGTSSSSSAPVYASSDEAKTVQWGQVFTVFQSNGKASRAKEFAKTLARLTSRSRDLLAACNDAVVGEDGLFQAAYVETFALDPTIAALVDATIHSSATEEAKTEQWTRILESLAAFGRQQRAQEYHQVLATVLSNSRQIIEVYHDSLAAERFLFCGAYEEALKLRREAMMAMQN